MVSGSDQFVCSFATGSGPNRFVHLGFFFFFSSPYLHYFLRSCKLHPTGPFMITICPISKAARRLLALPRALSAGTGGRSPCPCVCPRVPVCVPVCVPVSLSPPRPHTGPSGARRQMAVRGSGAAGRTRKVSRSEPPARPPSLPPPPLPALPARMEPVGMAATAVPDAGPGPGWQSKVRAGGGGGCGGRAAAAAP